MSFSYCQDLQLNNLENPWKPNPVQIVYEDLQNLLPVRFQKTLVMWTTMCFSPRSAQRLVRSIEFSHNRMVGKIEGIHQNSS